jgi:hypothetical protein
LSQSGGHEKPDSQNAESEPIQTEHDLARRSLRLLPRLQKKTPLLQKIKPLALLAMGMQLDEHIKCHPQEDPAGNLRDHEPL